MIEAACLPGSVQNNALRYDEIRGAYGFLKYHKVIYQGGILLATLVIILIIVLINLWGDTLKAGAFVEANDIIEFGEMKGCL